MRSITTDSHRSGSTYEEDNPVFERRLFYLQTVIDAAPRSVATASTPAIATNRGGQRVFRLPSLHRRPSGATGGAR